MGLLEFRESIGGMASGQWGPVPPWARFLIDLGHGALPSPGDRRRITLVSMPCDSPGAALVALGAMRRRLGMPGANNVDSHFDRLRLAAERGDTDRILRLGNDRARYVLGGMAASHLVWAVRIRAKHHRRTIRKETALDWWFEDEGRVHAQSGDGIGNRELYRSLVEGATPPREENLGSADSAVCIATRPSGESATRDKARTVNFRKGSSSARLDDLLAVGSWRRGITSRVSLVRTQRGTEHAASRDAIRPSLLVADGRGAFLRTVRDQRFRASDVVAVVRRDDSNEKIDGLGDELASMARHYAQLDGIPEGMKPPSGMALRAMVRR